MVIVVNPSACCVAAVPPSINQRQVEFISNVGNTVKLPCDVQGDPKPKIIWTKGGVHISDMDPHYLVNEDGSLDIFRFHGFLITIFLEVNEFDSLWIVF